MVPFQEAWRALDIPFCVTVVMLMPVCISMVRSMPPNICQSIYVDHLQHPGMKAQVEIRWEADNEAHKLQEIGILLLQPMMTHFLRMCCLDCLVSILQKQRTVGNNYMADAVHRFAENLQDHAAAR